MFFFAFLNGGGTIHLLFSSFAPPPFKNFLPRTNHPPPLILNITVSPSHATSRYVSKSQERLFPTLISVEQVPNRLLYFFFFSLEETRQIGKGLLVLPGLRDRVNAVPGVPPYIRIPNYLCSKSCRMYILYSVILTFGTIPFEQLFLRGEGEGSRN